MYVKKSPKMFYHFQVSIKNFFSIFYAPYYMCTFQKFHIITSVAIFLAVDPVDNLNYCVEFCC